MISVPIPSAVVLLITLVTVDISVNLLMHGSGIRINRRWNKQCSIKRPFLFIIDCLVKDLRISEIVQSCKLITGNDTWIISLNIKQLSVLFCAFCYP